jgi:hypothetical protein
MKTTDLQKIASNISSPKIDSSSLGSILRGIASQLSHPDAYFYDIAVSDEGLSGFFEGGDKGVPFSVGLQSFASSAYTLDVIAAYEPESGRCWDYSNYEGPGMTFRKFAEYMVEDMNPTAQAILRHAIECEWADHITRLAREISSGAASSSVKDRIYRTVDTAFCDAVTELARIIEQVNAEKQPA